MSALSWHRNSADVGCRGLAFYVIVRSELINTAAEAKDYYAERIAGLHDVNCHGKTVRIFFEGSASHTCSLKIRQQAWPFQVPTKSFDLCTVAASKFDDSRSTAQSSWIAPLRPSRNSRC